MDNKLVYVVVSVLFILVVIRVALTFLAPSGNSVAIQLTDPPQVPSGTQSLVIGYSSLAVHLSNAGNDSGWLSSSGTGSVDLLSVVNLTQTMGTVSVPKDARIDQARFNVDSATIKINGTAYNVTVPSGKVTAHIMSKNALNGSSSVLLELSPTVASIVTNTSTVYVLVPSLRAVIVGGGSNATTLRVGAKVRLTSNHTEALKRARANVSITAASLSVSAGNVTRFSITLKDNSNSSVVVKHVGFVGNVSARYNASMIQSKITANIANLTSKIKSSPFCNGNATAIGGYRVTANVTAEQNAAYAKYIQERATAGSNFNVSFGGATLRINNSICTSAGAAALTSRMQGIALNYSSRLKVAPSRRQPMIFSVSSSGQLSVPLGTADFTNSSSSYTLQAGQSATFSFTGIISFDHGAYRLAPIPGSNYMVGADVEGSGLLYKNVTATSG